MIMSRIYMILIGVLVMAAATLGSYFYGRHDGRAIESAKWEARYTSELALANQMIQTLQTQARETERKHAEQQAAISAQYQKEISDVRTETNRRIAASRSGTLKLRDPAAPVQTCSGRAPEAPASASGRDGPAPGELSSEASTFLLELTGEADEVVKQLTACQAALTADRSP